MKIYLKRHASLKNTCLPDEKIRLFENVISKTTRLFSKINSRILHNIFQEVYAYKQLYSILKYPSPTVIQPKSIFSKPIFIRNNEIEREKVVWVHFDFPEVAKIN